VNKISVNGWNQPTARAGALFVVTCWKLFASFCAIG